MSVDSIIADPWCAYLPHLHRALADPAQRDGLPIPSAGDDLQQACAVWETLHYLLTVLLGWSSPGHGLAWWFRSGKPTDDSPHLLLVKEHWDRSNALDAYAAWAWTPGKSFLSPDDISPETLGRVSVYPDEDWWRQFKRRGRDAQHDPFYGGSNPLHLGHSDAFGMAASSGKEAQLHWQTTTRRAVLVVNDVTSWRHDLAHAADRLPALGDRSWYVEVFDRRIGYLGLYRQSRDTGRWFAGKHSQHMLGQNGRVPA